jgi:hypothetical protein
MTSVKQKPPRTKKKDRESEQPSSESKVTPAACADPTPTQPAPVDPIPASEPIKPLLPPPPPAPVDILTQAREAIATVPAEKLPQAEANAKDLHHLLARCLRRGLRMQPQERQALLTLLVSESESLFFRYELILEGLNYLSRTKEAQTLGTVRKAKAALRIALSELATDGAPPDLIKQVSQWTR